MYSLRTKISQDLHDEVASTLSGIRLYSELAKQQLDNRDIPLVQRSLNVISDNASEMKEDMSDIIWAINPGNDSFGKLLKKLEIYLKDITAAAGIDFQMQVNENIPSEKLNMQQRRNVYLICKEAVNNAVKYSSATTIGLNFKMKDNYILIVIKDNGSGFDIHKTSEGNGLLNMKLRAKEIGGLFFIESDPGKGTAIELKIRIR
jgi:signal transduction histidine kinase